MTRGRYYFAPPGTPTYPGYHLFGSRTWDDQNFRCDYPLGEVRTGPDQWDSGGLPEVVPYNRAVGTADCIAGGELLAHAIPIIDTIAGFPSACFISPTMPTALERKLFSIFRCDVQVFYARLISAMYDDDDLAIAILVAGFTDGQIVATVHASTPALPSVVTIVTADYSVCVMDGSRTPQQFAAQALYGLVGPQNFGVFGTSPFWYGASQYALLKLTNDGGDPTKPMLFVGHSYGGVVAALCAVRALTQEPFGKRSLLTFGMPKPGDERLALLLAGLRAAHISNDDDAITILPPRFAELFQLVPVFGPLLQTYWPRWETPDAHFVFDPDGSVTRGQANELDYYTLSTIITRALAPIAMLPIEAHRIAEYARRININCKAPQPPAFGSLEWSNRPTAASAKLTLKPPAIPTGRLKLRGARDKPGTDCASAPILDHGKTYTFQHTVGKADAVLFAVDPYANYILEATAGVGAFDIWAFGFYLIDCADFQRAENVFGPTYSNGFNPIADTHFIMFFVPDISTLTGDITVKFSKVEDDAMIGQIAMYGAATPPAGWLGCDGSAISRTTFAGLFAVIGTTWGVGDGSTTFNLPDMRGRAPIGYNVGGVPGISVRLLADIGGEELHTLTNGELPAHIHSLDSAGGAILRLPRKTGGVGSYNTTGTFSAIDATVTGSTGSGFGHNTMQPFSVVKFIIKA